MINSEETWKDVCGYEGVYQISNCGNIKRIASGRGTKIGRMLNPSVNQDGYLQVILRYAKDRCSLNKLIHRLVLESFVGPCPIEQICRHLDGNKANNCIINLQWGTYIENENDKVYHGTRRRGSRVGTSILTDSKICDIKQLLVDGCTHRQIAKLFSVGKTTISDVSNGKTWRHVVSVDRKGK